MVIVSKYDTGYDIEVLEGYTEVDGENRYVCVVRDLIDNRYNAKFSDLDKEKQLEVINLIKTGNITYRETARDYNIYVKAIKDFNGLSTTPRFIGCLIPKMV